LRRAILLAVAVTACSVGAARADGGAKSEHVTVSGLVENDVFFDTDRDYTNGLMLSVTLGPDSTPAWLDDAACRLPIFEAPEGDCTGRKLRRTIEFGQNMYTPTDITLPNPPLTDRPYAGFLYLGLGFVTDDDEEQQQLQLQLGVVGPASLADRTQTWFHGLIGAHRPQGWHTQLKNEPALVLTYERSWRSWQSTEIFGLSLDLSPHLGGAVGNVYDYVNGGAMVRFGLDLPKDFGPPRIDPSLPGSSFPDLDTPFSAYVFAGVDGRAIGRNLFLDGNSFVASRHVAKNPLVGDFEFGWVVVYQRLQVAFTHVFRTKEYHTQPGVDQFGSVTVSYTF
jgi:hypothetical protein